MTAVGMCLPGMLTIGEKIGTKLVTADDAYFDHFARLLSFVRVSGSLQNTTEPAGTTLSSILAFANATPFFAPREGAVSVQHSTAVLVSLCSLTRTGSPDLFHHRHH